MVKLKGGHTESLNILVVRLRAQGEFQKSNPKHSFVFMERLMTHKYGLRSQLNIDRHKQRYSRHIRRPGLGANNTLD